MDRLVLRLYVVAAIYECMANRHKALCLIKTNSVE
jgi:hypothetical protein